MKCITCAKFIFYVCTCKFRPSLVEAPRKSEIKISVQVIKDCSQYQYLKEGVEQDGTGGEAVKLPCSIN